MRWICRWCCCCLSLLLLLLLLLVVVVVVVMLLLLQSVAAAAAIRAMRVGCALVEAPVYLVDPESAAATVDVT